MTRQNRRTRLANARARSPHVAAPATNPYTTGVTFAPDGSRSIHLTETGSDMMRNAIAFAEQEYLRVWGRPMGPNDPIFADFDAPTPQPMSPAKSEAMIVDAMVAAGFDPAHIYAFQCSHVLLTESNENLVAPEDRAEWYDAIRRYRALHG